MLFRVDKRPCSCVHPFPAVRMRTSTQSPNRIEDNLNPPANDTTAVGLPYFHSPSDAHDKEEFGE